MAFAMLLGPGVFLTACEPPNNTAGPTDTSTVPVGEASLLLKNQRAEDAGIISFYLYKGDAQSIDDALKIRTLAQLGFAASKTVKVAAGKWKIGYATESGDLHAMPPANSPEGITEAWPPGIFANGKTYYVTVETDTAALTVWNTNLPLE